MSEKAKEIVTQVKSYSGATLISQFVTLAATILTRRFLGPLQTGIWSLLQVILTYTPHASMGSMHAVAREIPFYLGKGDKAKASELKNTVFVFMNSVSVILSIVLMITAFILRGNIRPELFYGLLMVSGLVILQRLSDLMISLLRAYKEFQIAGKQMIWSSIFNAFCVAILSYKFQIYGFMWAMVLSFLFNIAFILFHYTFSFEWKMSGKQVKDLIGYGFPLMILGLTGTLLVTVDKLMVAKMLGLTELGYYSIAVLAYNYLAKLLNSAGIVLVPHFHEKYGERENKSDLKDYVDHWSYVSCYVMPILIGGVWFVGPGMIRLILPDFVASIPAIQFLSLASFFLALGNPFHQFLITIKKHFLLFPILFFVSILAVGMNYFAIKNGHGIIGVAIATTIAVFVKFSLTYFLACNRLQIEAAVFMEYGKIIVRFAYLVTIVFVLTFIFKGSQSWGTVVAQVVLFGLLYLPFLFRVRSRLKAWSTKHAPTASA